MNSEKTLIFIPYQDTDAFFKTGIMTREIALLKIFYDMGYHNVINVIKPRTRLDYRKVHIDDLMFPLGSNESDAVKIINSSRTVQHISLISFEQIIKRRAWWINSYKKMFDSIKSMIDSNDVLVYCNNPYAFNLLTELKQQNVKIYFDVMDNFAIHPSLSENERHAALEGYKRAFQVSDYISANSVQTCEYMKTYTNKQISLVKNGVFKENNIVCDNNLVAFKRMEDIKQKYEQVIGYIGKIGLRLDADLIQKVASNCKECAFVFIGYMVTGQNNKDLLDVFQNNSNVFHLGAIPSAYVYSMCDLFDVLSIPHSVGKNENGGDPLKLYQYMTRSKPIISTPILGVDEFKEYIYISDDFNEWIDLIKSKNLKKCEAPIDSFIWESRLKEIVSGIAN